MPKGINLQKPMMWTAVSGPSLTFREAVADVYGAMHAVVAMRQAALDEDRVEDVMAGAFFRPEQRLLLWMGGVRPTDMLACGRIKVGSHAFMTSYSALLRAREGFLEGSAHPCKGKA